MRQHEVTKDLMVSHGFSEFRATFTKVADTRKILAFCRKHDIKTEEDYLQLSTEVGVTKNSTKSFGR